MAKNTKISKDLKNLKSLAEGLKLKEKYKAKIGIIGDGAKVVHSDSMKTNTEIGMIHEFGTKSGGMIPERSFLRFPIEHKKKELIEKILISKDKIASILSSGDNDSIKGIYAKLGIMGEAIIQEAFETRGFGTWASNSAMTIANKGSDSPLIDTSQLRKSVTSTVISK